jgi:lipid-A-disaccharide synthase
MLEAVKRWRRDQQVQFLCVRASTIDRASLRAILDRAALGIPMIEEQRYEAVKASDLVWAASGTATVETALLLKPMIIVYRVSWITYWLARLLVRVDHIGMVNIIAGKRIVPELVQADFRAERLVQESRRLLSDRDRVAAMVDDLSQLREKLGKPGAAERVADLALSMIH